MPIGYWNKTLTLDDGSTLLFSLRLPSSISSSDKTELGQQIERLFCVHMVLTGGREKQDLLSHSLKAIQSALSSSKLPLRLMHHIYQPALHYAQAQAMLMAMLETSPQGSNTPHPPPIASSSTAPHSGT
jgi:hypothetical protein